MFELGDLLSLSNEQCLSDIVGACLILAFEGCANEAELQEATIGISQEDQGSESQEHGVVSNLSTNSSLNN